jgi:uncharacterized RDD family membrane protein YckC
MHGLMGPPDPASSRPLMGAAASASPIAPVGLCALLWAYVFVFAVMLFALQTIGP